MKKRRLKPFVKVTILAVFLIMCIVTVGLLNHDGKTALVQDDSFTYVNDYIFDSYYPVINQSEKISKPFTLESVSIYKNFYDKDASEDEQKKSIIYHENIYMQNSGVDYKAEEQFDVVSSLSGTVSNVTDDTLLGKTVEIRNSTELIMVYQSLGEVSVKKGDAVTQGQIIGKSGSCKLNSEISNGLHFEVYNNGKVINPEKIYGTQIKELSDN